MSKRKKLKDPPQSDLFAKASKAGIALTVETNTSQHAQTRAFNE